MRLLNAIFVKNARRKNVTRKKTLDEINHHLMEFSCSNIPLNVCLSKTGALSADLITNHYSEVTVPKNIYDSILIMFTSYYVLLHINNYTGNYTINKDYIYKQLVEISDEVMSETANNRKFKSYNLHIANHKSCDYIRQLLDVYYKSGIDGCLKYLTFSIYSALLSVDKEYALSKNKIENVIRTVQAEKFLDLFKSTPKAWS